MNLLRKGRNAYFIKDSSRRLTLHGRSGWRPSDSSNRHWNATHAARTNRGYRVLLTGRSKLGGRFKIWHVNRKGLITRSSSWKTKRWALRNGWEKIFGDVIRRDGVIGVSDDFARNRKTRGRVRIGRSTAGNLEKRGDRDWFKVSLKAGRRYQFDLTGKNLRDPYLYLRRANGKLISENDDGGRGLNARITFTARSTGKYFLDAGSYDDYYKGKYKLSAITVKRPDPGFNNTDGYGHVNAKRAFEQYLGINLTNRRNLEGNLWGLDNINAPEIWAKSGNFRGATGQNTTVAVIDTGIDYSHREFKDRIINGYDFVDNDSRAEDGNGHGTHVAGTIAGAKDNIGITGVAYNADIMPIRVLDNSGSGYLSDVIAGIRWAADNGADVINLSLGGGGFSQAMFDAVKHASENGAVVVMASGNSASSSPGHPASHATRYGIAVGAVNRQREMAGFSNRAGNKRMDYVTAPGVGVYSAIPGGGYTKYSGTSMAAPHVAGVAALLKSHNNNLSPERIENLLVQSAENSIAPSASSRQRDNRNRTARANSLAANHIITLESISNFTRKELNDPLVGRLSGGAKEREKSIKNIYERKKTERKFSRQIDSLQSIDISENTFATIDFVSSPDIDPRGELINLLKTGQFDYFEVNRSFTTI